MTQNSSTGSKSIGSGGVIRAGSSGGIVVVVIVVVVVWGLVLVIVISVPIPSLIKIG